MADALPPGDDWQPIATAPKNAVEVEVWNGRETKVAHHAEDRSGEEQPPFGPAWFYAVTSGGRVAYYNELFPQPTHWRPLNG